MLGASSFAANWTQGIPTAHFLNLRESHSDEVIGKW